MLIPLAAYKKTHQSLEQLLMSQLLMFVGTKNVKLRKN